MSYSQLNVTLSPHVRRCCLQWGEDGGEGMKASLRTPGSTSLPNSPVIPESRRKAALQGREERVDSSVQHPASFSLANPGCCWERAPEPGSELSLQSSAWDLTLEDLNFPELLLQLHPSQDKGMAHLELSHSTSGVVPALQPHRVMNDL